VKVGDIAVLMDEHVGVDDEFYSYVLHPGDSGLVVEITDETTSLLISNHLVYVETRSLEKLSHPSVENR